MKKIHPPGFILYCLAFIFSISANAQELNMALLSGHFRDKEKSIRPAFDKSSFSGLPLNEINIKAARNFIKSFNDAEDVYWIKLPDRVIVRFTEKGIKTRVDYDKKGNRLCSMRSYHEGELPEEIRTQIKTVFCDLTIAWINEITKDDLKVYLVQMQGKNCLKTIRVIGEKMETIEEYLK